MALDKADWTLLAIAAAGRKGLTPAQLQKTLFLVKQNFRNELKDFYAFEPYNYGPFDKSIYEDARVYAQKGMVKMNGVSGQNWSKYYITTEGAAKAQPLRSNADTNAMSYLEKIVHWAQSLSFPQLISAIYKQYPEYKVNSVFKEEI